MRQKNATPPVTPSRNRKRRRHFFWFSAIRPDIRLSHGFHRRCRRRPTTGQAADGDLAGLHREEHPPTNARTRREAPSDGHRSGHHWSTRERRRLGPDGTVQHCVPGIGDRETQRSCQPSPERRTGRGRPAGHELAKSRSGPTAVGLEVRHRRLRGTQLDDRTPFATARPPATLGPVEPARRGRVCTSARPASAGSPTSGSVARTRASSRSRSRTVSRNPAIVPSARTSWRRTEPEIGLRAEVSTRSPAIWVCCRSTSRRHRSARPVTVSRTSALWSRSERRSSVCRRPTTSRSWACRRLVEMELPPGERTGAGRRGQRHHDADPQRPVRTEQRGERTHRAHHRAPRSTAAADSAPPAGARVPRPGRAEQEQTPEQSSRRSPYAEPARPPGTSRVSSGAGVATAPGSDSRGPAGRSGQRVSPWWTTSPPLALKPRPSSSGAASPPSRWPAPPRTEGTASSR